MTVLAIYGASFLLIVSIIALGYRAPQSVEVANISTSSNTPSGETLATPAAQMPQLEDTELVVDRVAASAVAANVAKTTNLPVEGNVMSLSVSLAIESELAQADQSVISKPQLVQVDGENREIVTYTVKAGDTVPSVALAYNITPETLKWANDLTSDALEVGRKLSIPPTDGIIYTVESGDTVDSIADKYKADKNRIILYNDLKGEVSANRQIVIPSGSLPENERPGYVAPRAVTSYGYASYAYGSGFSGNSWHIKVGTPMYGGNKYAFGNCTAYAYDRRMELGRPVGGMWGNGSSWAYSAQAAGFLVNKTPAVGAIIQNGGGYGHVAIVEQVLPNGDIRISEMNAYVSGGGYNKVNGRIISAGNVASYNYIH